MNPFINCIGIFKVSKELVKNGEIAEVLALMAFIPMHVNSYEFKDYIVMCGISYLFDEVKEGEKIPDYEIKITTEKFDIISIEAIKK